MIIEKKKLKDLKPNPINPRKSSVTQDENLRKSLEKFGVVEPIVFNKQSGYIVGGHFRVRELIKMGVKEVECVIVDLNEWCGVILYGTGATINIASPYKLAQGEVIELVRVALNSKQGETSKSISLSLKLIKKQIPLCKLIVSYADIDQFHNGIIYQATNWFYTGKCNENTRTGFIINGKKTHNKSLHGMGKTQSLNGAREIDKNATEFISKGKHKYIYPLDKSLIPLCKSLSKPYPKKTINAGEAQEKCAEHSSSEVAVVPTHPLNNTLPKQ